MFLKRIPIYSKILVKRTAQRNSGVLVREKNDRRMRKLSELERSALKGCQKSDIFLPSLSKVLSLIQDNIIDSSAAGIDARIGEISILV